MNNDSVFSNKLKSSSDHIDTILEDLDYELSIITKTLKFHKQRLIEILEVQKRLKRG